MVEITKYFLAALHSLFKSRFELQAEILVLRHQLNVLRRRARSRPHLTNWDRLLLVWLYRLYPSTIDAVAIIAPDTLIPGASKRLPGLLALEVAIERRPSQDSRGGPQADPQDEPSCGPSYNHRLFRGERP
jgi:hypothetical protein